MTYSLKLWKNLGIIATIIILNGFLMGQMKGFSASAATPTPAYRVYLPLIFKNSSAIPTSTVTKTATKPVATNTPTTKPVSTSTPTTKPVSTNTPTTKPVSTSTPTTKPASTSTPTTKPVSTSTPTTKPISTSTPTTKPTNTPTPSTTNFATQAITLINQERAKAGCKALTVNSKLTTAAYNHSQDMALKDYFSHTGLNGSTPATRVEAVGYTYSNVGENITAGPTTPADAVKTWMGSPEHKANILDCTFTETGLGYYYLQNDTGAKNYNHYWTQVFGTP